MNVYPGDPEPNMGSNVIIINILEKRGNEFAEWERIKALPRDNNVQLRNFLRKLFNKDWVAGKNPNILIVTDIIQTIVGSLYWVFEQDPGFALYVNTFIRPEAKEKLSISNPELYQRLTAFENGSEYNMYKTAVTAVLNGIKGVFHEDRLADEFKEHYRGIIAEFVGYLEVPRYNFETLHRNLEEKMKDLARVNQQRRAA